MLIFVLKIFLYIIIVLITLLIISLFLPVSVQLGFKEEFYFKIRFCFIKVLDSLKQKPQNTAKDENAQQNLPPDKNNNYFKKIYKDLGLKGSVRYFSGLSKIILQRLKYVIKHITVTDLKFLLTVPGNDAAQAALNYGTVCSALYPAFSLLFSIVRCKAKSIDVKADFENKQPKFEFDLKINSQPFFLLIALVGGYLNYKKYEDSVFNNKERSKNK